MKTLNNAKLVGLLADNELADFARLCEISERPLTRETIAKSVAGLDTRRMVDALIAALVSLVRSTLPPLDVLAIDISPSHLADARSNAAAPRSRTCRLHLTFGGDRVEEAGGALDQELAAITASRCSKLEPLVSYLENLRASGVCVGTLEVWSDGKFDEVEQERLRGRLSAICTSVVEA